MRIFPLIAVLIAGIGQAAACPGSSSFISPSATPLPPDKFRGISKTMSVQSIIDQLDPAAQDVGSGLYVLVWEVTDGRIFFVSTSNLCGKPFNTGFKRTKP